MKTVKKAAEILISVLLWAIILIMALFTFTTLATKDDRSVSRIAGFTPLTVQSQSMSPTFNQGDLIVIKACNTAKLVVGDVITFHTIINNEYALNTHRIESIAENNGIRSYVTKGDNNAIADTHIISDGDIVGKYMFRLPLVGKLMNFLSGSTGFLLVIVLPMLLFFVYQVYHLIMVSINLKKAIAAEEATEASQRESEAAAKLAEAEAALAEAKRLKEEAEAKLAQAGGAPAQDEGETNQ
ncbi:MAG: signal peptidase I [Lachnospiraceae bacterium]|nr:signal peptidase I [Lachnospiraceae bacterium]